jgi:hypothetical protein
VSVLANAGSDLPDHIIAHPGCAADLLCDQENTFAGLAGPEVL